MHHLTVHGERLHLTMGEVKDRSARSLVDAAALHPHEAVLHHVDPTDAVASADLVQGLHDRQGVKVPAVHGDTVPLDEIQRHDLSLVRGLLGTGGELEHGAVLGSEGIEPRILEDSALVADVKQITVHRVGFLGARLDGNLVTAAILDHLRASRKLRTESLLPPGSDHLQIGGQGGGGKLEADLIIPLAGCSVSDGVGLLGQCNLHHALGDEGARNAGAEEILPLVHCSRLHHREDEITGELGLKIVDVTLGGSCPERLGLEPLELLLLTDVGAESDHLGGISFLDPVEDDGGIQTSRIGNDDFHGEVGYINDGKVARRFATVSEKSGHKKTAGLLRPFFDENDPIVTSWAGSGWKPELRRTLHSAGPGSGQPDSGRPAADRREEPNRSGCPAGRSTCRRRKRH